MVRSVARRELRQSGGTASSVSVSTSHVSSSTSSSSKASVDRTCILLDFDDLDAQLDIIAPPTTGTGGVNSGAHHSTFYSNLQFDAIRQSIVTNIKRFSSSSSATSASSTISSISNNCSRHFNRFTSSRLYKDFTSSPFKSNKTLNKVPLGALIFAVGLLCVVAWGNMGDSDSQYEAQLAQSHLRRLSALGADVRPSASGGPTNINAMLEERYRSEQEKEQQEWQQNEHIAMGQHVKRSP